MSRYLYEIIDSIFCVFFIVDDAKIIKFALQSRPPITAGIKKSFQKKKKNEFKNFKLY